MKYLIEISILIYFFITNSLGFEKLKKKMTDILEDYETIDRKMDLLSDNPFYKNLERVTLINLKKIKIKNFS